MKRVFFLISTLLLSGWLQAAEVRVAVAANFRDTLGELAQQYQQETGNKLLISGGPTGALYNQIIHGAPFDLFFSADTERPQKLEDAELIEPGSHRVYALGQLMLWDPKQQLASMQDLQHYKGRLSIASPDTAPYGEAAMEVLEHLQLTSQPQPFKLVRGNSIAQAYQYVYTRNAEVGFVAASQVIGQLGVHPVPTELYRPLEQSMVQLKNARNPEAARAFADWLASESAAEIIRSFGYALPE